MLEEVSQIESQNLQLQQRIREGDNAAFAELYAGYKQGVFLYCTRFLGDRNSAEDIFQEVFMNLLERVRSGSEIENVQGYLLRSARNRCLNVIRDRKYPKDVNELEEFLPGAEHVMAGEYGDLESALQELPAVNREALLLCEYEGYSYDEIAQMTECSLTTVRKRIYRARQKLRQLLTPGMNRTMEQ
ncbi:MAG: RNA polymerase sigma factor [Bacteroidota bacterium]